MKFRQQTIKRLQKVLLTLLSMMLLTSCAKNGPDTTIEIYAGSATGAYSQLVELINARSNSLKSTMVLPRDGDSYISCREYSESCPLLSKFDFKIKCTSGGSKTNLVELGMITHPANEQEAINRAANCEGSPENNFALVQNFFVEGAAQTYCPFRTNKFGPDMLYFFEFKSDFPWVGPQAPVEELCQGFFEEKMGISYDKFEDLRIVLPLYSGLIQFVTVNRGNSEKDITLDNLVRGEKRIYLPGVNEIYGAEVLNRDPRFQNSEVNNTVNKNWLFDEDLVLSSPERARLDIDPVLFEYINQAGISQRERGDRMLACNIIDAYGISGEIVAPESLSQPGNTPDSCRGEFTRQQIQIPEVIIDAMIDDHPYYQKIPSPSYWPKSNVQNMPGILTYLVTTASTDQDLVKELTQALAEEWDSLMLLQPELAPIKDNILKKPAPFHAGAAEALLELDLLGGGFSTLSLVLMGSLALLMKIVSWYSQAQLGYNRLGEKQSLGLSSLVWLEAFELIRIVIGWIFVFMFVVTMIREWDAAIAATLNSDDQISGLSFSQTLLWMFTFISSGYEDNVFPSSSASQIAVGLFALAGIAYPLFLIAQTWDRIRAKQLNAARGGEFRGLWRLTKDWFLERIKLTHRSKGTLLLCGWNDRAPGVVYTLTCPDSPFEGVVNIVADMEAEYPIQFYNFNKRRVRFYRGDASHRNELERAEAGRASSALILSEHSSDAGANSSGVLTALAIERFKSEISVFAELSADENDREFLQNHIDNIVDPRTIVRQVLTIGCFDNYVLDFVLDALSPDDHSEWYSKRYVDLLKLLPTGTKISTALDLAKELQQFNISVVGVCSTEEEAQRSVFAPKFDSSERLDALKTFKSLNREMKEGDYVICSALHPSSFKPRLSHKLFGHKRREVEFFESDLSILNPHPSQGAILIVGHKDQADAVSLNIKETVFKIAENTAEIKTRVIATDLLSGNALNQEIVTQLAETQWTHILLLSSIGQAQNQDEHTRLATRADSDTILRASFIKTTLEKTRKKREMANLPEQALPTLVCEVNRTHSRQLAQDAEIDIVVPTSLLIERILVRLVSGGGKVPELLSAMLSMQEGAYLRSQELKEGDGLVGQKFSTALNTWYKDGRILGILPKSGTHNIKDDHRNQSDDFDWHFIMCPHAEGNDPEIAVGDVVIALACTESE